MELVPPCRFKHGSAYNEAEAEWAVDLARRVKQARRTASVMIVCLYKAQRGLISALLGDVPGVQGFTGGQVQGSEGDVVILATANPSPTPFAVDPRLCHVVLTT